MDNHLRDIDDNRGRALSSRLPLATRTISHSVSGSRRSSEYMVLSVPVWSYGDDGNIVPEHDLGTRLDGILQVQQRLDRNITQIRNQQTRPDRRITALDQLMGSMYANVRSIA